MRTLQATAEQQPQHPENVCVRCKTELGRIPNGGIATCPECGLSVAKIGNQVILGDSRRK